MKNKLYYHIFLSDDYGTWSSIFMEQVKLMEDHNLIEVLDEINIGCVYTTDHARETFEILANSVFKNPNIIYYHNTMGPSEDIYFDSKLNSYEHSAVTENVTMKRIFDDSQKEDFNILYLHSKGVTSVSRHLKTHNIFAYLLYFNWRQYLQWAVIENWKKCVGALDKGYDIASANFMTDPVSHVSGGIWWSKASYIRNLDDPTEINWYFIMREVSHNQDFKYNGSLRHRDEMWICCRNNFKFYHVHLLSEKDSPAYNILPRKSYTKTGEKS